MSHLNVEIKARLRDPERVRQELRRRHARFAGVDHQRDTYFCVPSGRLKVREGNIENSLIFYDRRDESGPKRSDVHLCDLSKLATASSGTSDDRPESLPVAVVLSVALGVLRVVEKQREIYFLDNVKFHIDEVLHLGAFMEIEAIDMKGDADADSLRQQCEMYMDALGIDPHDLERHSYSDLLSEIRADE